MKGYLVRVGIDQAFGGWNAPIDPSTGAFVYVPIPERRETRFHPGMARSYAPFRAALQAFAASIVDPVMRRRCIAPSPLDDLSPHLDPDFDWLTYGDNGLRRGKGLCDLRDGDYVVFFAGMRPVRPCPERLVYGIIGFFRVAEALRLRDVPRSRWDENAHTRKIRHGPDDVILRARPGESGRLGRALAIGEFRDRAYRVRRDLLDVWGDLSCRDGFIQRSAVPPAFRDPARFLRWFEAQSPVIAAANNPGVSPAVPAQPAAPQPRACRASAASAEPPPVVLVHLRQPSRSDPREMRTDPLYEFGSFGLTGCHSRNLLRRHRAVGARLGFVQPGPGEMRLVLLTPPATVVDHGERREASWKPRTMPLRFAAGLLLIDNSGGTRVPALRALLSGTRRGSWVARFSSRFRARCEPLPAVVAAELVEAWSRRVAAVGRRRRAIAYWEALPFAPPMRDTDRKRTWRHLLADARGAKQRRGRRC